MPTKPQGKNISPLYFLVRSFNHYCLVYCSKGGSAQKAFDLLKTMFCNSPSFCNPGNSNVITISTLLGQRVTVIIPRRYIINWYLIGVTSYMNIREVVVRVRNNAALDGGCKKQAWNRSIDRLSCWRCHLVWYLGLDIDQLLVPLLREFPLSL